MPHSRTGGLGARRCRVALLPDSHVSTGPDTGAPTGPVRRLYGCARRLLETSLRKLSATADAIFLLGDTLDPADPENLAWLKAQVAATPVPVHVLIGNHETYGDIAASEFHGALGLPTDGHQVVRVNGVPFLMLATPSQDSLAPGRSGYAWFEGQLAKFADEDTFCCAHFSLLLHPCVQGWRNDGMQVLHASQSLLDLVDKHPRMRAWIAGHKNVPSMVERNGALHLLSPQLIQAPCGYRMLDIYENGLASQVHSIDETSLANLSRDAYGPDYPGRHGRPEDRDFAWRFPS